MWGTSADDLNGDAEHALALEMHRDSLAAQQQARREARAANAAAVARDAVLRGASAAEAGAAVAAALGGAPAPQSAAYEPTRPLPPGSGFYAARRA